MDEANALNGVADFHRTFNVPVEKEPIIPSDARCMLRVNLLEEELEEFKAAIQDKDLVEIADALCDLQYVLSGAILEFGLGQKFSELFDEVQRSNMSKVCKTRTEAEATLEHYRSKRNIEGHIEEKGDVFIVYRNSDHKVLKSVKYSPADLKSILVKSLSPLGSE